MKLSRRMVLLPAILGAVAALLVGVAACTTTPNANNVEHAQANAGIDLILSNQPVPIFPTSAIRGELVQIEAIEALGTPTTTFFFPPGTPPGKGVSPVKTCASQGEPVPNTASLTNPLQATSGGEVVGQADPNGTYTPQASSGTFVLCVTPGGGTKLTYWEGDVFTESGAAAWNTSTGQIDDIGPSQLPICTKQVSNGTGGIPNNTAYYHCVKA